MALESILQSIQEHTRERCLRWQELFRDFDRNKNKHITRPNFNRGLAASGLKLSEANVELLTDAFAGKRSPELVDYGAFCDAIDAAFVTKGLEKNPNKQVRLALPSYNLHHQERANVLDEETKAELTRCLGEIAQKVRTENIVLKPFWTDFDKHKCGYVTQPQFCRGLTMIFAKDRKLSSYSKVLPLAYEDNRGNVNYRRLSEDVDKLIKKGSLSLSKNSTLCSAFGINEEKVQFSDSVDIAEAITRMREIVAQEGVGPGRFFVDLDKMRAGAITRAQFKNAINSAFGKRVHLNAKLLDALADRYTDLVVLKAQDRRLEQEKVVYYKPFVDEVDNGPAELRNLYSSPSKTFGEQENTGDETAGPETEDEYHTLVQMRHMVKTRNIYLKPSFMDFDRHNCGVITKAQFLRVLDLNFASLNFSVEAREDVAVRFSRGAGNGVNYQKFLRFVNPSPVTVHNKSDKEAKRDEEKSALDGHESKYVDSSVSRAEVVLKLQRLVTSLGIRLRNFFSDADRNNHGVISVNSFSRGLSRARVELSSDEVRVLVEPFIRGGSGLRWRELMREIESAEVVHDLHLNPCRSGYVKPLKMAETLYSAKKFALEDGEETSEQEREINECLNKIRVYATTRRVLLLPAFKIHDKNNSGKLGVSLFRRALDSLQLKPLSRQPESVFEGIAERFATGRDSMGLVVDYRRFISYVNNVKSHAECRAAKIRADMPQPSVTKRFSSFSPTNRARNEQSDLDRDFDAVMLRVKDQAWSRGIRVKGFFDDYDRLRKGLIPESKFISALNSAGFTLNSAQIEVLKRQLRSTRAAGPCEVAYMPFVEALDGGNEKLEAQPKGNLQERKARSFEERHPVSVDPVLLRKVLLPMRKQVRLRRLHIEDSFKDKDKMNCKAVTLSQFAAVLKTSDILPLKDTDAVLELLQKAYPSAYKEGINYVGFVKDLETSD